MLHVDASVLVAAFTVEKESLRMREWLIGQRPGELAISDWTITEFSSALSLKLRTKQVGMPQRNNALAGFNLLIADSFKVLAITSAQFRSAAQIADQHALGIRAGDALHLAVAIDHSAMFCTLDRRLAEGGKAIGANTWLL
jgi:hypothetical protein